ncbi:hypothetical protein AX14_004323 [Amanita brunnescens Koide BX004]|nr:hypothetical protein AX14_004323 [Amanita brunnescens Koide BX004]
MSSDDHNFLFASLHSNRPLTARKVHIRRLYDVLQLCIQRQDFSRARRAWAILARCKEIQWKSLWITSLLLVGDGLHLADSSKDKIDYLRSLMLQHLDDREAILTELIHSLIVSSRYREALDELELYLPSFPYQDNPVLHIYAGLLSLYLSQEAKEDISPSSSLLRDARSRLEHARELDPDNEMVQMFIQKIATMQPNRHSQINDADSDQEHMVVDHELTPKSKRARMSQV